MDTQKAFGLSGGLFNVSGLQTWGGNLSANNLLVLQTVTDIEAPIGVRLWELWYQQKFGDKFDLKIGEQSLDEEFFISPSAYFFINSASGWPELPSADLPGGGPAYPLAGLGVRGRAQLTDALTVLAGVFNGSPIPRGSPNTPVSNPHGVSFPLDNGIFAIAELQYAFGSDASGKPNADGPLPGVYKIGAWYDSASFADLQYDTIGGSLASLLSDRIPAAHRGDFSLYAIADQAIWRSKDDASRTLNVFIRPMFAPFQDRNLVSASLTPASLCMRRFRGATAIYSASKWGPHGRAAARSATTGGCNSTSPRSTRRFAAARLSSKRAIRLRSCPRGRFSLTSSMSSTPAWESPTRTIRPRGSRTSS